MRIKMLTTKRGSPDGVAVNTYSKGQTYDVPDDLGGVFVGERWAKKAAEPKPDPDPDPADDDPETEAKDAGAAPEDKNAGAASENKGDGAKSPPISPVIRKLLGEHGIDAATIEGTGKNGAILKADVLRAVEAAAKS